MKKIEKDTHIEKIWDGVKNLERVKKSISEIARLYCEIWREPPWDEDFWTIDGVVDDMINQLSKPNAIFLFMEILPPRDRELHCCHQIEDPEITGFTWGYEVSVADLSEISGVSELRWRKIIDANRAFYIDELGVEKNHRRRGVGKELTERLLIQAANLGIDCAILRTAVKAVAARNLYQRLGFRELDIADVKYPDRTYWLKKPNPRNKGSENCPLLEHQPQSTSQPWGPPHGMGGGFFPRGSGYDS